MAKSKSAFVGYTEDQVKRMETYFVLQFGGDFVLEDNYYLFTKSEVSKLYGNTLKDLLKLMDDGSDKEKAYALDLIGGLRVKPMRLH